MTIADYIESINKRYKTGISREHSYRGDLQTLLEAMLDGVLVTNEPSRIECGAPDYILTRNNIPVGYIEAKDIGEPLEGKKHKEQFARYKESLDYLIFTDYLQFHLYREGEFATSVRIADIEDGAITPKPGKFDEFRNLMISFSQQNGQTIRSASKLSKMMAGKARLLSTIIENALRGDERADDNRVNESNNTLREQLAAFQNVLIHDIDEKEFAGIYAQTIAYGMFAARLHDSSLKTFTRHEAAELIPKTNPFLRKLFQYIAGYDLDDRIVWVVDALADIFRATDVSALLKDFGKSTQQNDPIIHFYETFLAEFDPRLRKSRGVWYTPEPVVNFIVRAVDDILKDDFGLKDGLADTSKTTVKVNTDQPDKRSATGYKQEEKEVHKVQILDPAAGTGTFLAEVVKQIHSRFEGQQGIWPNYVENHLIPRLNGFEILMASYAMAHLKLDLLLRETGYDRESNQRFRVYLTNSLEEHHPDTGTLFAGWLSSEANEANHIKRDTPVMVVLGNPPYSVSSSNKGEWIRDLISDYKKGLKEKKINLDDDYIKFIRYGEHFIEKNGEGVLAYISNNSFIDGVTHRQMRKHLLEIFDKIFILDLHGSSMKNETAPDGSKDENVFDILQGVSINIFVKKKKGKELADVLFSELFGRRKAKYNKLSKAKLFEIDWEKLPYKEPYYFFIKKDLLLSNEYNQHFSIKDLFKVVNSGIK
ncbi:MAG TPA: N-6 DNA methylase, partial [Balneolaceae bacterium]|nr:N-6 DNA methylase [Balneolaceae bacterium]